TMTTYHVKQEKRWLRIDSIFGEDTLIGTYFEAEEALSTPFCYRLSVISPLVDIKPEKILGETITVLGGREQSEPLCFHGHVARFTAGTVRERGYRQYDLELVPKLWFLQRTSDCRIFENKSVRDILEEVLGEHKVDLEMHVNTTKKREYCV